jgi:hypothetical protein
MRKVRQTVRSSGVDHLFVAMIARACSLAHRLTLVVLREAKIYLQVTPPRTRRPIPLGDISGNRHGWFQRELRPALKQNWPARQLARSGIRVGAYYRRHRRSFRAEYALHAESLPPTRRGGGHNE